jgi:hypothetical protein
MLIILPKRREPTSAIVLSWMLTYCNATMIRTIVPIRTLWGTSRSANRRVGPPFLLGCFHMHICSFQPSPSTMSKGRSGCLKPTSLAYCVDRQRGSALISYIATICICAAPVKVSAHTNRSLTCADLSLESGKICAIGTPSIHHLSKGPKKKSVKRMRVK